MPHPLLPGFLGEVAGAARDVLRRVLPREKMSESEVAAAEAAVTQAIEAADWKRLEAVYADRADARALAAADVVGGSAWTTALAALHRPVWSLATLVLFVWIVVSPQLGLPDLSASPFTREIMQTVIVFYFGGRTVEKVTATIKRSAN